MFKIISKKRYEELCRKPSLTVADLCNYHILRAEAYPCDLCRLDVPNCLKISFAELADCHGRRIPQTICICHKDRINV